MSRARLTVLLAAATSLAGLYLGEQAPAADPERRGSHSPPSRILVTASEWSILLSQPKLPAGPSLLEFRNRGEDPHDLRIRRLGGKRVRQLPEIGPGALTDLELRLRRGSSYRLWCSLDGHRELGMQAKLRVTRK